MSEHWVGPGWWYASDGMWYPPHDGDNTPPQSDVSSTDVGGVADVEFDPLDSEKSNDRPSPVFAGAGWVDSSSEDHTAQEPVTDDVVIDLTTLNEINEINEINEVTEVADSAGPADATVAAAVVPQRFSIARPEDLEAIDLTTPKRFENTTTGLDPRLDSAPVSEMAAQETQDVVGAVAAPVANSKDIDIDLDAVTDAGGPVVSGASSSSAKVTEFMQRAEAGRPASVTRRTVGPSAEATSFGESKDPRVGTPGRVEQSTAEAADLRPSPSSSADSGTGSGDAGAIGGPNVLNDSAFWDEDTGRRVGRRERPLFVAAVGLAVLSGVLGALWLRERSVAMDLRTEVENAQQVDDSVTIEELEGDINTLTLQNEQLEQQLTDMSALVLELPEGRVTEIDVPLNPVFADEENGRLIAMDAAGEYVVFGDGVERPITDSGSVGAAPTGLFAATAKAWVSTDAGQIQILPLTLEAQAQETVDFGPVMFLAADERGYWTFDQRQGQVVRLRKSDGGLTDSVDVPVGVSDLAIGAGSVWALGEDGIVYRINTADLTVQPIDAGEDLISLTAGPDALWTLSAADGSLRRIDPVTGAVLVTVPVGRDPIDATFAGSSVWVALRSGSSLIEVDTRTSAVVSRTVLPSQPAALHQGDSGVFVTTEGEGAPLLRIDSLIETPDAAQQAADVAEADE